MSSRTPSPSRLGGLRACGCLAGVGLLAGLLATVGLAGWLYLDRPVIAVDPVINVLEPATGALLETNAPVIVQALAEHDGGLTRIELYADGALVAAQDSDAAGANPLVFLQTWTPTTPGRHVLVARTYTLDGRFVDSGVVVVDVAPAAPTRVLVDEIERAGDRGLPSLEEIAEAAGLPLEELLGANPELGGHDPGLPLDPGTPIVLPRPEGGADFGGGSGAPPPPTPPAARPGTPAAPTGLTAVLTCASAQLGWTDSPDEERYAVYRLAPGAAHMERVAALAANSTSFSDPLSGLGEYHYQVAALRGGEGAVELEGPSLVVMTATPGTCVPPAVAGREDLVLTLGTLETLTPYAGTHCYAAVNGGSFTRWPAGDFSWINPSVSGGLRYALATQVANRGRHVLTGHLDSEPVTLSVECLGHTGTLAPALGAFTLSHAREEWDNRPLMGEGLGGDGFRLYYCIGPSSAVEQPCDAPVLGEPPIQYLAVLPPIIFTTDLPAPHNLQVLPSREACGELFAESARAGLACVLFGAETLHWDWTPVLPFSESTLTGYHVEASRFGFPYRDWDVRPGTQRVTLVRPSSLPCGQTFELIVTAVQGERVSAMSAPLAYDTPACPLLGAGPAVVISTKLTLTFKTLDLGPTAGDEMRDYGDLCINCIDRRLELRGRFGSLGPDPYRGYFDWIRINAGRGFDLPTGGCNDVANCLEKGSYPWRMMWIVSDEQWAQFPAPYEPGVVTLIIKDGQSLVLAAAIEDRDLFDAPDPICLVTVSLDRTAAEWAVTDEIFVLESSSREANCQIPVLIQGVAE